MSTDYPSAHPTPTEAAEQIKPEVAALFNPLKLGDYTARNRVFLAPLTRCRNTKDHVPTEMMNTYYTQRSGAGLVITECTLVAPKSSAFGTDPGIYSEEQIAAWKDITESVHAEGGLIFMQIWHPGRAAHPKLNDGVESISSSALRIEGDAHTPMGRLEYTVPRAMTVVEIKGAVEAFVQAAKNAMEAGFDGVEIHGANGYLIDQFLRSSANQRTDEYGGSVENRMRFLIEVVEGVTQAIGSGKTGLRLSPLNAFNSMKDEDPVGLSQTLAKTLSGHDLAYLHVIRSNIAGSEGQEHQKAVVAAFAEHYTGNVVLNCDFGGKEGSDTILNDKADAIAYGTTYIANPDLPERFKAGAALNEPNPKTFYTTEAEGYIDYPFMDESA